MRFPSCLRNVRRAPRAAALLAFFLSALVTFGSPNAARAEVGDDIVNQGLSLHSSQNYQSAINAFEDYARRYPNGSQRNRAELFAGHSYMLLHKYTTREEAAAAQQHFNYILNQGQNARYFKEALFHTAHLAYDMENFDIARARFQDFLRLYPNDAYIPYVLYYLANCETKFGNPSGALQLYERALRSYPDSNLAWNCQLEHATLVGKTGNYQAAENELVQLANTTNLPYDVAGQVAVQRALLRIVQQQFSAAINVLEDYISRYRDYRTGYAPESIRTAYLYEAYAYYALRDYNSAISIIENNFERNSSYLPPEVALLKIKLYIAINRVNDAEAILNSLAGTNYGRYSPDVVVAYRGLIDLMRGNYDRAIQTLTNLLQVRISYNGSGYYPSGSGYTPANNGNYAPDGLVPGRSGLNPSGSGYNPTGSGYNPNNNGYGPSSGYNPPSTYNTTYPQSSSSLPSLQTQPYSGAPTYTTYQADYVPATGAYATIGYFSNVGGERLDALDCVEACETLILAYASRYARLHSQQDYDAQEAIYYETQNFANWLKEPTVTLLVNNIDKRRRDALVTPIIAGSNDPYYIVTPYASNGYSTTPGQFVDPTRSDRYSRPDYFNYGSTNSQIRPYDYYQNQNYRWGDQSNPNTYESSNSSSSYNNAPANNNNNNNNNNPQNNGQNNQQQANNGQQQNAGQNAQQQAHNGQQQNAGQNAQQQPVNGQQQNAGQNAQQQPVNGQQQNAGQNVPQQQTDVSQQANYVQPAQQNPVPQNTTGVPVPAANSTADDESKRMTPADAEKTLKKAENFFRNQDFERCNDTLYEALTSSETFWQDCPAAAPKIALLRANALVSLGKTSEAQMSFQDVVDNAPNTPEATVAAAFIGFSYDRVGRTEDAVKYLRRATSGGVTTPFSDAALYYLGLNERERGNNRGAKEAFDRLHRDFKSSPYWSHATWALAQLYADERDDKQAEQLVNEALGSRPDSAIIVYLLFLKGEIALRAKDFTKALIAFDMIVDQYPDSKFYSMAKNRLAAIPAQYRGEEDIYDDEDDEDDDPIPARPAVTRTAPSPAAPVRPAAPRDPLESTTVRPTAPTELPKAAPLAKPAGTAETAPATGTQQTAAPAKTPVPGQGTSILPPRRVPLPSEKPKTTST